MEELDGNESTNAKYFVETMHYETADAVFCIVAAAFYSEVQPLFHDPYFMTLVTKACSHLAATPTEIWSPRFQHLLGFSHRINTHL